MFEVEVEFWCFSKTGGSECFVVRGISRDRGLDLCFSDFLQTCFQQQIQRHLRVFDDFYFFLFIKNSNYTVLVMFEDFWIWMSILTIPNHLPRSAPSVVPWWCPWRNPGRHAIRPHHRSMAEDCGTLATRWFLVFGV